MIHTKRIETTLHYLDSAYQSAMSCPDVHRPVIYAKLAILEYCGWIEESFDEIARNCVRSKLRTRNQRRILEDKINGTHGFSYNNNARSLLAHALGTIKLTEIESLLEKMGV